MVKSLEYGVIWRLQRDCLLVYQTLINHTGDNDLKKSLEDMTQNMKQENQQVENLLKANGIGLPPSPPERPIANLESIPVGARFNDPEIAAGVSKDIATGLVLAVKSLV
jgi:hypothetical protein